MTNCADVCIDMDFDAPVEAFTARVIKARKEHKCVECRRVIRKGDNYEKASGKCEGDWFTAATCEVCLDVRTAVVCGSWEYGCLWEHIDEYLFPSWKVTGPYDCLEKVKTKEARDTLMDLFNEWRKR